jgi:hypothetical protein
MKNALPLIAVEMAILGIMIKMFWEPYNLIYIYIYIYHIEIIP